MRAQSGAISHVVLYVYDFPMMKDFYTGVMGFHLSDIGQARGNDIPNSITTSSRSPAGAPGRAMPAASTMSPSGSARSSICAGATSG